VIKAYWTATLLLGTEGVVGGVLALLRLPAYANVMQHLGYPSYLMSILGVWYTLAGAALLAPRFPRLKEWAYAGLLFNYTGRPPPIWLWVMAPAQSGPMIFTGLTIASWALRPPCRRLSGPHL